MNGFLLDTNCVSELVSPQPALSVTEWMDSTDENLLYLSALTIGEIRKGVAGLANGKRKTRLEAWLEFELPARFAGRVVPIDSMIADRWGMLAADMKRLGKALSVIDGLIAATAIHHNLTIVSRNLRDFSGTRAKLLNLWNA
jgi:predicted nucleic acid-binding protein